METKNMESILKNIPSKTIISGLSFLLIGLVYAGLFSSLPISPSGQTPGGSFSGRLNTTMVGICSTNQFLKGFDTSYNPICVPSTGIYSGPAIVPLATPTGSYPNTPMGQFLGGKFGTYFSNLVGVCPGNTIIKGFASDGWKYCVDPATPNVIVTPHTSVTPSGIIWPVKPTGESTGGKFQDFFTAMFTTCGGSQVINGIKADGSLNCIPAPVNCVGSWSDTNTCDKPCGSGVKQQVYNITTPAANGGASCSNVNGATQWGSTSCNTQACPVNCVGSWSDTNTCDKLCGGGVKQQVYNITTPAANGGASCSNANGATQWGSTSCNTQACACIPDGSCNAPAPNCGMIPPITYGTDNCGNSCFKLIACGAPVN